MTVVDQTKIMQNEAQYDLDKKAAKILKYLHCLLITGTNMNI